MTIADVRPDLVPTPDDLEAAMATLHEPYRDYVNNVSTDRMAIGHKSAAYIYWLCEKRAPHRRADFGSGFSSYVLRLFDGPVVSVDDSPEWLDKTAEFLKRYDMPTDGLCLIDEYKPARYDLIVYDYAGGDDRNRRYGWVTDLVDIDGLIFYDDAHHPGHAHHMRQACGPRQLDCFGLGEHTADDYGRYGALGVL